MNGFFLLLIVIICTLPGRVFAACYFSPDASFPNSSTIKLTVPIANNIISVPSGTANGATVYMQKITISTGVQPSRVHCNSNEKYKYVYGYKQNPLPETAPGSQIYETGIAGLGIRFSTSDNFRYTYTRIVNGCGAAGGCDAAGIWSMNSYFELVKTGDIAGGSISASDLPTIYHAFGHYDGMVEMYEVNFSGTLTTTTPTCDVSPASTSMTVNLGKYDVSDFSSPGSGTQWKNSSIILQNCGIFSGDTSTSIATFDGAGNTAITALTNNSVDVTLTPLDGNVDAANGIMAITDNPAAAVGVGIQLSASANVSGKINLDAPYTYPLPKDGSPSITIPLFARYIQTGSQVFAGKANGTLIFTLSYR